MKRRDFIISSTMGTVGAAELSRSGLQATPAAQPSTPKIVIAGGGFGTVFIKYMASLTGKARPKVLFLPTAAADRDSSIVRFYENCSSLDVTPSVQRCFIASPRQEETFEEVLLSVDAIVVSGGNTLNQQVIWRAHGIDQILRQAWERGIVLGGASAGSLCWFEEGTTDSRPQALSTVECLGFLPGSHSPHYDAEEDRRPLYRQLVLSGELKPGYACDNDAGIYFEGTEVRRVVRTREDASVYHVSAQGGEILERELPADMIS